ncbi:hypothetical_protein (plasmid) [Leishmania braziliensis MHOM/BR/75/M2904]|uniref:Hypothetical_protein n=1 Tax=Leishmania braziliensis MHOM/BR/75/M2904 TaxID=420245 RepID=A0A3P3Z3G2_LEIBR|nr:hypothetical_protein [Leishmania braziliensis MHOM/BR/75/M2904]
MPNIAASWVPPHPGGGQRSDHSNNGRDAAAAALEVFQDFTWYSATLLSHLFALEHAQLERAAAVEESHRRAAAAHSPQLLMSAAVEAVKATAGVAPASAAAATSRKISDRCSLGQKLEFESGESGGGDYGSGSSGAEALATPSLSPSAPDESQKLSQIATQHRPHILLGFSMLGDATARGVVDPVLADSATRWALPQATKVAGLPVALPAAAPTAAAKTSASDTAITALLTVFDAYYFPSDLFYAADTVSSAMAGEDGEREDPALLGGGSNAMHVARDGARSMPQGGTTSAEATGPGTGSGTNAPSVTAEALREAFHALLVLGQRCAVFALKHRGIIGCSGDAAASLTGRGCADFESEGDTDRRYSPRIDGENLPTTAAAAQMDDVTGTGFSSEDDARADEAVQQRPLRRCSFFSSLRAAVHVPLSRTRRSFASLTRWLCNRLHATRPAGSHGSS